MTDRNDKTIPDLPAAHAEDWARQRDGAREAAAPGAQDPFDPFKFQSITMPPGLRAEIMEQARQRSPERAPEDTLPPGGTPGPGQPPKHPLDQEAAMPSVIVSEPAAGAAGEPGSDAPVATEFSDTARLPRVILRDAARRRKRWLAIAALLGVAGALVWQVVSTAGESPSKPPAAALKPVAQSVPRSERVVARSAPAPAASAPATAAPAKDGSPATARASDGAASAPSAGAASALAPDREAPGASAPAPSPPRSAPRSAARRPGPAPLPPTPAAQPATGHATSAATPRHTLDLESPLPPQ